MFSAVSIEYFSHFPWFRISFILSLITFLYPFCAASPAWARVPPRENLRDGALVVSWDEPIVVAFVVGGAIAPAVFFLLFSSERSLGFDSSFASYWWFGALCFCHGVSALFVIEELRLLNRNA